MEEYNQIKRRITLKTKRELFKIKVIGKKLLLENFCFSNLFLFQKTMDSAYLYYTMKHSRFLINLNIILEIILDFFYIP